MCAYSLFYFSFAFLFSIVLSLGRGENGRRAVRTDDMEPVRVFFILITAMDIKQLVLFWEVARGCGLILSAICYWMVADAEKYNMGQGVAPYPGSLRHEESIEAIALYEKNARAQSEQSDPSF